MKVETAVAFLAALERERPCSVRVAAELVETTERQARRALEGLAATGLARVDGRRGYVLTAGGRAGLASWRERGGR